jgi:protein phosphatase
MEIPNRAFAVCLEHAALTDVGMRRANNQDGHAVVLAEDERSLHERGHLLMVADGMGAHAAGELASKLAVDNIPHLYHHYRDLSPPESLRRAILDANTEIHRRGQANPEFHSMGTTASVLVLLPQGALVGHVGDSRVYRLRGNRLDQLTFDHSLQWELRSLGRLSEDSDLAKSVPKNVITRSLGPNSSVDVDLEGPFPLEVGDTFLLCSDGLTGQVEDQELAEVLAHLSPDEAAKVLVDLANLRGGPDNITLIVAKIDGSGLTADAAAHKEMTVGGERTRPASGLAAAGVVTAVCLFLAFVLWFADQRVPAVVSAVGGVVSIIVGIVLRLRGGRETGTSVGEHRLLGKGPHAHVICKPGDELVTTLSSILKELREVAEESQWEVQWNRFDNYNRCAADAAGSKDFPEAVRNYAKAISFMMEEFRNQQNKQAGDSALDL